MRSVSTLARWLHTVRHSLASSAIKTRRERAVRRLRAQETAADPWLAEERVLLSAPAVVLSVASATYTENAPPVTLDPGLMASDPDADLITAAAVKIVDFESGQDQLSFTSQFGITGSFDNATGILSLSGVSTATRYAMVLSSVQYLNLTDAPNDLTRTIEFTLTDTEPLTSVPATLTLNLVSVADTPANVVATVNEDTLSTPIVLAPNPIDGTTVTHFQISGITNGALFQNDGVTPINNGDFVTTADAAAGLKFQGNTNYFGPAEFKFQAAVGNTASDLGGNVATATITVNPVADTPANVLATVDEDTLSGPIVLTPNAVDGASVTHFQITGITNGTLYLNDGVTVVNSGDFVTVADAALGLKYQGNANYFGPAQFNFQAATGNMPADLGGNLATAALTVNPVADSPANVMATVNEDTLSLPLVLVPNPVDGASVTHFQITGITNGTLYQADGVTVINNGDFITLAQATAGVTFQGNPDYFGPAQFQFQASTSNMAAGLAGALATASITVNPVADTPANVLATIAEDTLSGAIILTPNAVDGASVTHIQITGITNGTLYLNDGLTVVSNGDFVTVAEAGLGLKFQGNLNYFGAAEFKFQAAVGNTLSDLGGAIATASITVNPIADTPANVLATVNEDTLSGPIVLTPNAVDGASVTHFQITGITNGTLYLNDGVTVVNNADFVTVAEAALGLKYQGNLNYFGPAEFKFQAARGNTPADLGGSLATAAITVVSVNDPPTITVPGPQTTAEGSSLALPGIVINDVDVAGNPLTVVLQTTGPTASYTLGTTAGITFLNGTTNGGSVPLEIQGTLADLQAALNTLSIQPHDNGTLNLTIVITDELNGSDQATIPITVANVAPTLTLVGTPTANEGDFVTVTGSATDPANTPTTPTDNDPLTFTWSVTKDGNAYASGLGNVANFQVVDNGIYIVTMTVNDGDLGSDTETHTINVANVAPTLTLVGPPTANEGDFVTVTGSATDPANQPTTPTDNDPLTFTWSVTKDGNAYASGLGNVANFQVVDNGIYIVTMTVNDGDLGSDTETHTINVANVAPTLTLVGPPTANEGDFVTVTGSATDPANQPTTPTDNDPLTFTWSVTKDGNAYASGVGPVANFQVVDNGVYIVTMTVNDGDLGSDTETHTITVANVAPTLTLVGPPTANEGDFVTVTGSATDPANTPTTPTDNDPLTFTWSVTKDGNAYASGLGNVANFQVVDNGVYIVTMTVNDGDLGSDTETHTITVANVAPTLTLVGPPTANEGDFVTVTGSATDPANQPTTPTDNDSLVYTWTATKDGNAYAAGLGNVAIFQAVDNGLYVVTMIVTDDDLGSDTETFTINVLNVAPTPTVTGNTTGFEGTPINLAASSTDPANMPTTPTDNDSVTYAWQVLRNGVLYDTGTGTNYVLTPNNEGTYQVFLTASDEDGGSETTLHTVTVANVAPTATINATDINGQFYTYVDIAVDDPGNDGISVLIIWGDINPADFLNDPFLVGETATTRTFPTVEHRYLTAPNPQDPLAPVTITFFINDGTETIIETRVVDVTEQGIPAGGVYITPEPEQIVLPPPQVIVLPPDIVSQPSQLQVRNEEIVSREDTLNEEDARLVLHVVGPTGVEGPAVTLPDGLLQNLRGLFAKLPDGHYRVYLVQGESRRLVIEVFVRQGRAIDPAEADQGTQERPPQNQPAAQQEPERVMQAEPVGQAVPDKLPATLDQNSLAAESNASPDPDPTKRFAELLTAKVLTRQAVPDLQNSPETDSENPQNADQTGVLSLAAAGVVAGESWRRTARRQRAAAVTTGSEEAEKNEKTWSRLARRARQWKPR